METSESTRNGNGSGNRVDQLELKRTGNLLGVGEVQAKDTVKTYIQVLFIEKGLKDKEVQVREYTAFPSKQDDIFEISNTTHEFIGINGEKFPMLNLNQGNHHFIPKQLCLPNSAK